ncbi:MAG TPA: L,D-transpeptidase family protein [Acidimicrobiales bacterium]|nr:L,D-transpeptidase family protein [Acidimicrobiales bacterium]
MRLLFGALALTVIAAACGSGAVSETAPTTGPAPGVMSPAGLGSALATTPTTTSAAAFTPAASPVTSTPAASVVTGAVTSTTPAGRGLPRLQVADRLPDEGGAQQLVVVEVADSTDTFAQVQAFDRVDGQWQPAFAPTTARIGRSGISAHHHEGDGTTPQGVFTLTEAFGDGPDPGTRLPYRPVHDQDYWVTDSSSPYYNTWQSGPPAGRWTSAEALWTLTQAYRHAVVIDYNRDPVVPGRGSAMFLHVRNENPTSGCVAVDLDRLVEIMRWLDPTKAPRIAIGTDALLSA